MNHLMCNKCDNVSECGSIRLQSDLCSSLANHIPMAYYLTCALLCFRVSLGSVVDSPLVGCNIVPFSTLPLRLL